MKVLKSFLFACLLALQSFGTFATSLLDVPDVLAHFRMVWSGQYATEQRSYFEGRFGDADPAEGVQLLYSFMSLSGEKDAYYKYGMTEIDTWGTNLYFALCCSPYGIIEGPGSSAFIFVTNNRGMQVASSIIYAGLNDSAIDRYGNKLSCRWCRAATPIPEPSVAALLIFGLLAFWVSRQKLKEL